MYKFYIHDNEVVAVSTYAKKKVVGKAKCSPNDKFDEKFGIELAMARCNKKVAKKRLARATKKLAEAEAQLTTAIKYLKDMYEYREDAIEWYEEAKEMIADLENKFDKN